MCGIRQNRGNSRDIMVVHKAEQMHAAVQTPGIRPELTDQGVIDLEQIHTVEARPQALAALIIGCTVAHLRIYNLLVVTAKDLSDQIKVRLLLIHIPAECLQEIPVQHIRDIQAKPVNPELLHPHPDTFQQIVFHILVVEIQLHKIIVAFPALVPKAIVVAVISVKVQVKPILVRAVPSLLQNILKRPEATSRMIEHAVQNNPDPCRMKGIAYSFEILIGAKTNIHLAEISCVVSVRVRFEQRIEQDSCHTKLLKMRDPVQHPENPVLRYSIILKGCSAHPERINLIYHAFFSPHSCSFPLPAVMRRLPYRFQLPLICLFPHFIFIDSLLLRE